MSKAGPQRSLDEWVEYIQTLHAREIDLSLERAHEVCQRMYPDGPPFTHITVAGTNGKGSTSELLASIYRAAGYRIGKYTSPHLVDFAERINIGGKPVGHQELLAAFERVEEARQSTRLTFFEFGTLLAIDLFVQQGVELAIMEVGLGGRLDAVNILDPQITVITNIALDHTAWLGDSLSAIAKEKFGVTRANTPCILGMHHPPSILLALAEERNVPLVIAQEDFRAELYDVSQPAEGWRYCGCRGLYSDLPLPFQQAGHQLENAAAALAAIDELQADFPVSVSAIQQGLHLASNPGRCQIIQRDPLIVLDVAHNAASVAALARFVRELNVEGRVLAVCGMLRDKQINQALALIAEQIEVWYFASISSARGSTAKEMADVLAKIPLAQPCNEPQLFDDVQHAFESARNALRKDDCLLVFGSFYITGDIIAHLSL